MKQVFSETKHHQLPEGIHVHSCPFVVKINPEPQPKHKKSLGPRMNTNVLSGSEPLTNRVPNLEESSFLATKPFHCTPPIPCYRPIPPPKKKLNSLPVTRDFLHDP